MDVEGYDLLEVGDKEVMRAVPAGVVVVINGGSTPFGFCANVDFDLNMKLVVILCAWVVVTHVAVWHIFDGHLGEELFDAALRLLGGADACGLFNREAEDAIVWVEGLQDVSFVGLCLLMVEPLTLK